MTFQIRHYGKDLNSLSSKDLQELESDLNTAIEHSCCENESRRYRELFSILADFLN